MKLSVITINKNNVNGLKKTIESVIAQSFRDMEYIIIDGASTDGSGELIKQYTDKISYWISEPDKGIYNAMNKGIMKAIGEYCLFLNSGDYLVDDNVLDIFSNPDCQSDIICGYVTEPQRKILPPPEFSFRFLYHQNIPHQAEFIKRKLFYKLGLYNEDLKILSDYEFNIKAILSGVDIHFINKCISHVEPNGISSNHKSINLLKIEGETILKKHIPDAILNDYQFWMDKSTYSHPAIKWLFDKKLLFKILKFLYKYFRNEK